MSPGSPLSALRLALPDLSPRLRDAARFVAENDFDATTRSMRDLAAAAGTTPANFTRLAQALGYAGWEELREALVEARRPGPAGPFSGPFSGRVPGPLTPGAVPAHRLAADAEIIAGLDPSPIATAAQALQAAPRLWIAGYRSCRGVAQVLHYQLRLFRPDEVRLVGGGGPEDLDLGALAAGDAVVLLGFAPYSRQSLLTARQARATGCLLVALADSPAAPMAEGADHLLLFDAARGPGFFPSLTGALALAQALAAGCFALGGEAALIRLRETEARLAALAEYLPDRTSQP
jgi:DNA-binding MurR/RpiR family transcriptional regulator